MKLTVRDVCLGGEKKLTVEEGANNSIRIGYEDNTFYLPDESLDAIYEAMTFIRKNRGILIN